MSRSTAGNSISTPVGGTADAVLAACLQVVQEAIRGRTLEGHLAALVLWTSRSNASGPLAVSPWEARVAELLASHPVPQAGQLRTLEVATLGVRLSLGGDADRAPEYASLASRELAREAMPPAVRVHDDERLFLGLAAGVGLAAPIVVPALLDVVRAREHTATYRAVCLDIWAEALALGHPRFTPLLAARALGVVSGTARVRPAVTDDDRVVLYWLATRLLDAPWRPTDDDLRTLEPMVDAGRRSALTVAAATSLAPLDAAMLMDALTWSPTTSLSRITRLEYLLEVIEAFPASAEILANRARGRQPFEITDEYDVQDLFHALARPGVPDIVPEDPAPKLAGKSSRLDFTSKAARLGVEVKHVKRHSHAATVREEILIDEATYQEHPYIDTVIVFISDPERYIPLTARATFERDLTQAHSVNGRTVQYIVRVR